jgi:hypothetical protein
MDVLKFLPGGGYLDPANPSNPQALHLFPLDAVLSWPRYFRVAVSHAHLHTKLTRPLPTKDGATLRTIQDVCDYMAVIGKEREQRRH